LDAFLTTAAALKAFTSPITGKACSEETHSLRNPVLGAQAPKKEKETGHSPQGKPEFLVPSR
jgi:hypothetical protein